MNRLLVTLVLFSTTALAKNQKCDVQFRSGETHILTVPLTGRGALVHLPFAIRDVIEPVHFAVEPVGASNEMGQVKNAKSFLVSTKKPGASDQVTFFLGSQEADKGTLTLQLTSASTGRAVTNFCLSGDRKGLGSKNNYLAREMEVMAAMIRDEQNFGRTVISQKVTVPEFKNQLSVKAVRVFKFEDLTGYTFIVTNTTSKTVKLNLTNLAFGDPNRAVALHADHDVLEPCSKNQSVNPKENGCASMVRLLVTGNLKAEYLKAHSEFPFVSVTDLKPK